jgi:hypothetical protein
VTWNVSVGPVAREDLEPDMAGHRVSNGGAVPDFLVNMIVAEAATLRDGLGKVKIVTVGSTGEGDTRNARFAVEGSA